MVAAWRQARAETEYGTRQPLIPDPDDRGTRAVDQFFRRADDEGSAWMCPQIARINAKNLVRGLL
jgi:hypothetical protein